MVSSVPVYYFNNYKFCDKTLERTCLDKAWFHLNADSFKKRCYRGYYERVD